MSDILKALTGAAPIASATAAPAAGTVATASAAFATLPSALADLTAGSVLAGIVVERARGVVLLKTDKGVLQLHTNLALPIGAEVVLEVQSVGAQLRLAVVSVDQHPPAAGALSSNPAATPVATQPRESALPSQNPAGQSQLVGRLLTATIVGPPDPQPAAGADPIGALVRKVIAMGALVKEAAEAAVPLNGPAPAEPLPVVPQPAEIESALHMLPAPAREIVAALLADGVAEAGTPHDPNGSDADGPQPAPSRAPTPSGPAPESGTVKSVATDTATSGNTAIPAAAKTVGVRILAQAPPLSAPGAAPLRAPAPTGSDAVVLVGTVVAADKTGVEVATALGRLRIPVVAASLPEGTQIAFEVLARPTAERAVPSAEPTDAAMRAPAETTRDWSAARDLAARWPEAADSLLPKVGQPFAPALLAFIAAVRSGGAAKAWPGSRLSKLADTADKKELIARLGGDVAAQARSAAAVDADGWQTIAVPVVDGDRLSEVRFRFHKRRQSGEPGERDHRFMVEATLSALGALQLDGTVRERHLDLVVRSARALPAGMRQDIAAVFAQSLSGTEYRGEIRFRDGGGEATPQRPVARGGSSVVA
ncbi:MAG: hypothetical protein ACM30I_04635 [Gemmatimonas sp.]